MLVFNHSGLLVPSTLISSTFQELKDEFVLKIPTPKRQEIFDNFLKYNNDFKKVCNLDGLHQWIDGSYTTKKQNPGDIDVVTFLDHELINDLGDKLNNFKFPNSERIYGVDGYIIEVYPPGHKDQFKYISDRAYWLDKFTTTRRVRGNKSAKGFLEIFT